MTKLLTEDQVRDLYQEIEKLPLHLTALKYSEVIYVYDFSDKLLRTLKEEIDRLITSTPDYKGYKTLPLSPEELKNLPLERAEYKKKFDFLAKNYNSGLYNYSEVKRICDLITDHMLKREKFLKRMGVKAYLKNHRDGVWLQPAENSKANQNTSSESSESLFKDQGYSVASVVMAYIYCKQNYCYPFKELEMGSQTCIYNKIAEFSGYSFNVIRKRWPELKNKNTRKSIKNVNKMIESIGLLKTFTSCDVSKAINQATKEMDASTGL
jgi:hypothetical protein